jgi:tetratricopeptide (TPR) repeat protein/cold shock CspA family protein
MLSTSEVGLLLDLLEKHGCLGELRFKSRAAQVEAFMGEEYANRQLLVALHELTRGYPFEKIVLDEYERVPEKARRLYLDIATMHQFGVAVRAGTISRVAGIQFRDYQEEFFEPLKDLVTVVKDEYGDYVYKTRHPNIAAMVFRQVCDDDASRTTQFVRLIDALDVGYSADARTLEGICKGRTLATQFSSAAYAREIFSAATEAAPQQAYLFQQWAIFESLHSGGDMLEAERLADTAALMDQKNSTFVHTQAEIARKRAVGEASPVLKEQLRRRARAFLEKMSRSDRFAVSSRCKLLVDELADFSETVTDEAGTDDHLFAEKLKDAETMLLKAQQEFPDDAGMVEIEARLWNEIKDKARALRALERAWKKMPRGSGTGIRLGKIYASSGKRSEEYRVLMEVLGRNPDDKGAHFALAMHLLGEETVDRKRVAHHLGNSFQVNDSNFEPRYMLAQFLFQSGDVDQAINLFQEIDRRAPISFRRKPPWIDNPITAALPVYTGTIDEMKPDYCFIRTGAYPTRLFAHRFAFDDDEVDDVEVGQQVYFKVRFNRSGPVAAEVHLQSTGWTTRNEPESSDLLSGGE